MILKNTYRVLRPIFRGYCTPSAANEIGSWRNAAFEQEKARQLSLVTRVEKIQVTYEGPPQSCSLLMNKGLSTPFNCAMHMQELLMQRSVLALVDGEPWDMHRPLLHDCTLSFLHFKDANPRHVNQAFWRSGSFILGYILERAFKPEHKIDLCSFPKPNISSGSFVYDVDLSLPDWKPTAAELNCLSLIGGRLGFTDMKFERLDVDASVALDMFQHNRFKREQIPLIAAQSHSGNDVTLYRLGDHVDISRGPLISSSRQLGRFTITSVHDIESKDFGSLKRVQAVATPSQLVTHYWMFNVLCDRARKLNPGPLPSLHTEDQNTRAQQQQTS